MKPPLLEIDKYIQAKIDAKLIWSGLHHILKFISNLLASFMQENVYVVIGDMTGLEELVLIF